MVRCSSAPAEARLTVPPRGAPRRSGTTTPSTATASAVRRIAPTFCGSWTWSSTSSSGVWVTCCAVCASSLTVTTGSGATCATAFWCRRPGTSWANASRVTQVTGTSACAACWPSVARRPRPGGSPTSHTRLARPARTASWTGWIPQRHGASEGAAGAGSGPVRRARRCGRGEVNAVASASRLGGPQWRCPARRGGRGPYRPA